MPEPTSEHRTLQGLAATPPRRGSVARPRKRTGQPGARPSTASTIHLPWAVSYAATGSTTTVPWSPSPSASGPPPASVAAEPVDGSVREPWVTKRELAAHLHVALRWIEAQHHHGLPHARRGGVLRYRISEVEAWLRGEPAR